MKTKLITTIMISLFLASMIVIAVPVKADPTEWHVYWPGPIQDAINGASDWDTIIVHTGTYVEYITVNKRVTVTAALGEVRPVIDGSFWISGVGATVEGFEVRMPEVLSPWDGIAVKANDVTVRNNVVKGLGLWLTTPGYYPPKGAGISVIDCVGVLVEGNSVHETSGVGIWLGSISDCTIRDNYVSETQYTGILLTDWYFFEGYPEKPPHHNTIENNRVASVGTEWNYDDGIRLGRKAHDNWVLGNRVTASIRDGIRAVGTTYNNEIAFNKMRGNGIPATGGVDARDMTTPPGANDWHDNHFRTSSGPVQG